MARGMQRAVLRLLGAKDHRVEALETERLAPELRRVRFAARSLLEAVELTPTAWVRSWFPDPDGGAQEYQRAYSLFAGDVDAGWCDVTRRARGSSSLAEALAASAILLDHRQVWVAGESASLKALRRVVRDRAGASRSNTQVLAYWIEGRSMGKERRENA